MQFLTVLFEIAFEKQGQTIPEKADTRKSMLVPSRLYHCLNGGQTEDCLDSIKKTGAPVK